MILSEIEGCTSFSICDNLVAYAFKSTLYLRNIVDFDLIGNFKCPEIIDEILPSPDAKHIACIIKQKEIIKVFSIEDNVLHCEINAGEFLGIQNAIWSPNSQNIIVFSDLSILCTIWTLENQRIIMPNNPKNSNSALTFSPDERLICMIERVNFKDVLHFYDAENPQFCRILSTSLPTRDASSVLWSPDGQYIVVLDSYLYDTIVVINCDGTLARTLNLYGEPTGNKLPTHFVLGYRTFQWYPSGYILAVGRYDNTCILYNRFDWKVLFEIKHPLDKPIDPILGLDDSGNPLVGTEPVEGRLNKSHKVAIYIEKSTSSRHLNDFPLTMTTRAVEIVHAYITSNLPYAVESVKIDLDKPNPKIGVGLCLFSPNGRYLVTRVENARHALWIWSIGGLNINLVGLLSHNSPVTCVQWDPRNLTKEFTRLAFCTLAGRIFIWSPRGCLSMSIERPGSPFPVTSLAWSPSGDALLLQSSKSFCVLHLESENVEDMAPSVEPLWKAPSRRGRDLLEEHNRDPQTPARNSNFPVEIKSDLPKWALSAHRLTKQKKAFNG